MRKSDRRSGALLHISSLPGRFEIGTLGTEARKFADFLSESGFKCWQVLPLGPTGLYNSPYQSQSAFAGNCYFIDPELMVADGLLTESEVDDFTCQKSEKLQLMRLAFSRVDSDMQVQIDEFVKNEGYWLTDYARFMDRHKEFQGNSYVEFEYFSQYIFHKQWHELKSYVNARGIEIIGDMPIYVDRESVDLWSNVELFDMSPYGVPENVAGVPPDYFSEDGQLWGNPLYNWDAMRETGYDWWVKRFDKALTMFDRVRIDHFIGFVEYWAVPFGSDTAKNGCWRKGPGKELFDVLKERLQERIIAEDLGVFKPEVSELLEYTGFPGMRVMQIGFESEEDNLHLPHNYCRNCVAYTGTHDNNTLIGWMQEASLQQRERALWYCGGDNKSWIRTLFASSADLVIVPIQDICGFGSDARMNTPGTISGNWSFRLTQEVLDSIDREWLRKVNCVTKR